MKLSYSLIITFLMLLPLSTGAAVINYSVVDQGGGSWRYDYSVMNDSPGMTIEEFTIYFDLGLYQNLAETSAPVGWNGAVVQPGSLLLLNDGFYDAMTLSGIADGGSASIFSVSFDWLGTTSQPGIQRFEIIDPVTFNTLESGFTSLAQSAIPLPGAFWLFLSGVIGFVLINKKQR